MCSLCILFLSIASAAGLSLAMLIGVVGAGVVAVAFLILLSVIFLRRKRRNELPSTIFQAPKPDEWEYDPAGLTIGSKLGEGAFGVVMTGTVRDIQPDLKGVGKVAVKMCPPDATVKDKQDFIAECNLMKKFAKPWHTNVIRLLGVCTQGEELMMILEYASRGDLKNFLRDCRPSEGTAEVLSLRHRIKMALDVCNGMKFLSEMQFVHRDLACR
jgi:serine/threonine protein kinase